MVISSLVSAICVWSAQDSGEASSKAASLLRQDQPEQSIVLLLADWKSSRDAALIYSTVSSVLPEPAQLDLAIRNLERRVGADPQNTDLLLALGVSLQARGESAKAVDVFRHLTVVSDGDTDFQAWVYYLLAQSEYARSNPLECLSAVRRSVVLDGSQAVYHQLMGIALYGLRQYSEAAAAFARAIEIAPGDPRFRFNLALVHLALSELDKAEQVLKSIVADQPEFAPALYYLGRIYNSSHQNRAALDFLLRAEAQDPSLGGLYYQIGLAHKALGHDLEAIPALLRQTEIDPHDPSVRITLGDCYLRTGHWHEASQQLGKALELDPKRASGHFLLGKALIELGQHGQALEHLQEAVRLEPQEEEPHFLMARVHLKQGQAREAQEQIELYKKKKQVAEFLSTQEQARRRPE